MTQPGYENQFYYFVSPYCIMKVNFKVNKFFLKKISFILFFWCISDNIIKEISKDGFATAIWKDGPLYYCLHKKGYERKLGNKLVALKYLHNSQNITNEFLNEV